MRFNSWVKKDIILLPAYAIYYASSCHQQGAPLPAYLALRDIKIWCVRYTRYLILYAPTQEYRFSPIRNFKYWQTSKQIKQHPFYSVARLINRHNEMKPREGIAARHWNQNSSICLLFRKQQLRLGSIIRQQDNQTDSTLAFIVKLQT